MRLFETLFSLYLEEKEREKRKPHYNSSDNTFQPIMNCVSYVAGQSTVEPLLAATN